MILRLCVVDRLPPARHRLYRPGTVALMRLAVRLRDPYGFDSRHNLMRTSILIILLFSTFVYATPENFVGVVVIEKDKEFYVKRFLPSSLVEKVGFAAGDRIVSINNKEIVDKRDLFNGLYKSGKFTCTVKRLGKTIKFTAIIAWASDKTPPGTIFKIEPSRRPPSVIYLKVEK